MPPKQLEYQDTNGQDENVLNSSETEESQHNEYFDFEQQSKMFKEAQARQQMENKSQGPVGNRLTFGKDSHQ